MLLRILKTNQAYHFILIPFIGILLWLPSLIDPVPYPYYAGEDMMLLYKPIAWLMSQNRYIASVLPLLLIILLSFLSIRLNVGFAFIRIRTFLPASLLVLMISALQNLHTMHPAYLAAIFLFFAIERIFDTYEKTKINTNAFDAGLLIAIGSLFYLNLIFLFPIIWISFIILRKQLTWRHVSLPILGLAVPWLLCLSYFFFNDQLPDFIISLERNIITKNDFLKGHIPYQIYFAYLGIITLLSSFFLLAQYDEKKISTRKYFQVFFWIFFISVIILIAVPAVSQEVFIIMAIPLTYLISNYLVFMKRRFWGEVIVYILLSGVIYLQFI